jgi:hypothetical protein
MDIYTLTVIDGNPEPYIYVASTSNKCIDQAIMMAELFGGQTEPCLTELRKGLETSCKAQDESGARYYIARAKIN